MRTNIQVIPVDGNFGMLESGPVQFRNDFPGLYINGEDCLELLGILRYLREGLEGKRKIDKIPALLADMERTLAKGVLENSPDGTA